MRRWAMLGKVNHHTPNYLVLPIFKDASSASSTYTNAYLQQCLIHLLKLTPIQALQLMKTQHAVKTAKQVRCKFIAYRHFHPRVLDYITLWHGKKRMHVHEKHAIPARLAKLLDLTPADACVCFNLGQYFAVPTYTTFAQDLEHEEQQATARVQLAQGVQERDETIQALQKQIQQLQQQQQQSLQGKLENDNNHHKSHKAVVGEDNDNSSNDDSDDMVLGPPLTDEERQVLAAAFHAVYREAAAKKRAAPPVAAGSVEPPPTKRLLLDAAASSSSSTTTTTTTFPTTNNKEESRDVVPEKPPLAPLMPPVTEPLSSSTTESDSVPVNSTTASPTITEPTTAVEPTIPTRMAATDSSRLRPPEGLETDAQPAVESGAGAAATTNTATNLEEATDPQKVEGPTTKTTTAYVPV